MISGNEDMYIFGHQNRGADKMIDLSYLTKADALHILYNCPGVGVTKPISSTSLLFQIFCIVKTHFNC